MKYRVCERTPAVRAARCVLTPSRVVEEMSDRNSMTMAGIPSSMDVVMLVCLRGVKRVVKVMVW